MEKKITINDIGKSEVICYDTIVDYGMNSNIYVNLDGTVNLRGTGLTTVYANSGDVRINVIDAQNVAVYLKSGNITINGYSESKVKLYTDDGLTSGGNGTFKFSNFTLNLPGYSSSQFTTYNRFGLAHTQDATLGAPGYENVSTKRVETNNSIINQSTGKIENWSQNSTININDYGADITVSAYAGWGTKINGSKWSDKIRVLSGSSSSNTGAVATINAGAGFDTLTGSGGKEVYVFGSSDDANTITNYRSNDEIVITSGTYSTQVSGSDVIISVDDNTNNSHSTSICLQNAAGQTIQIQNPDGSITKLKGTITTGSQDVIFEKRVTLTANTPPVEIIGNIDYETNDYYQVDVSNVSLNTHGGDDQILTGTTYRNVTLYSGSGNDTRDAESSELAGHAYGSRSYIQIHHGQGNI